jgi:CubicO group peptidase (beta-lactamase class C family)
MNGGVNWLEYNTGLNNNLVAALAIDPAIPTTLHVGTWGGSVIAIQADTAIEPIPMPSPTISASTSLDAPSPLPSDWRASMDAFAQDSVANTPLAGMTLAVRRKGEPDWIQAYGYAGLEGSIPASPETIYQIGSLSMQFTAAAVMQLSERRQLDLNAPISRYLDGLPEALQSFTLHQLLTHTSLIYDSPFDTQEKFFGQQDYTSEMLLQELVPILQISNNDVREMFSYGNYILAGLIVERVSGMSYPDYLNQNIFPRASLQNTSYCLPPPAGMARGYYLPGNGFEPLQLNVSAVFAAGGLCSTAGDLLLWMDALSSGKVVSPGSYQQMITPAKFPDGSSGNLGYGLYALPDSYGLNTAKPDNDLLEMIWNNIPVLMPP